MTEPLWLLRSVVEAVHDAQLAEHGGAAGLRDAALLESALARPQQLHAYGSASLFDLAGSYAAAIIRNHPFIDGNKRTGFLAAYLFLRLNGCRLVADEAEIVLIIRRLAAGDLADEVFAQWLQAHVVK